MNTELLRKVTKVHASDGVYDGSMCHEAADEIDRLVQIMDQISVNRDNHELVGRLAEQAITEK